MRLGSQCATPSASIGVSCNPRGNSRRVATGGRQLEQPVVRGAVEAEAVDQGGVIKTSGMLEALGHA